ncbi:DUF309 domain-containing protein [Ferrigenium sp. UT5]|uniref:DUF309 domain-containing protein n=1 Tax=Ferrigenium sp. UT5 TaxID=3242105 RepID=UPI00354D1939
MHYLWDWGELQHLWNNGDFDEVHDWLNERWATLVRNKQGADKDADARFMQGLAFAAMALHFVQTANQEGARLLLDDALMVLPQFSPTHLGIMVEPVLETLHNLRPKIALLGANDEFPEPHLDFNKLVLVND